MGGERMWVLAMHFAQISATTSTRTSPAACITVRDLGVAQDVRLEAYGAHAIRVRAVPTGGVFRDDLISALIPIPNPTAICAVVILSATAPHSLTNGNLKVTEPEPNPNP